MSLQPKLTASFDDWLDGERAALEQRSEYVAGEVFAMTGVSAEHNGIVANIVRELGNQFKGRPCQVYANDMKVHIRSADAGKYPDLVAFCDAPEFYDGRRDVLLNPTLIVEVLSDSTEAYDRGDKFSLYRQILSLREYLLVFQHRVHVELFHREDGNRWTLTEFKLLEDHIFLDSVECNLALSEMYDKLELGST